MFYTDSMVSIFFLLLCSSLLKLRMLNRKLLWGIQLNKNAIAIANIFIFLFFCNKQQRGRLACWWRRLKNFDLTFFPIKRPLCEAPIYTYIISMSFLSGLFSCFFFFYFIYSFVRSIIFLFFSENLSHLCTIEIQWLVIWTWKNFGS